MRALLNRRRMVALAAVPMALVPVACTDPGPAPTPTTKPGPTPSNPPPTTCTTIDYESAKVGPGRGPVTDFPGTAQYTLVVTGTLPYMNWTAKLQPLVYIRQPEFWGIEVQACHTLEVGLPTVKAFTVSLPLSGVMGTQGIEVIGATKRQNFELPPVGPIVPPPVN
jgi:hypothetical protein